MVTRTSTIFSRLQGDDKYSLRSYAYPEDLGSEASGTGHFILFNINVSKGSSISKTAGRPVNNTGTISLEPRKESAPINVLDKISASGQTRRIDTAISLYMPDNITTQYNSSWELGEIEAATKMFHAYHAGSELLSSAGDIINNFDSETMRRMAHSTGDILSDRNVRAALDTAGRMVQEVGGQSDLANAVSLMKREFRNPYMEFLFRGVTPRTFQFVFKFMPRTQREVENVRNIITQFKYHALPEAIDDNSFFGMFYTYPSEFDITFFSNSAENKYLFKMSTCACTSVDVNYTPMGQWSAFRENPGEGSPPTQTTLTLTFTELELLTRQRIDQGF